MQETVTITKKEYLKLKSQAEKDTQFLEELISSLNDIKTGKVIKVR
jgi:hypothetical protein